MVLGANRDRGLDGLTDAFLTSAVIDALLLRLLSLLFTTWRIPLEFQLQFRWLIALLGSYRDCGSLIHR